MGPQIGFDLDIALIWMFSGSTQLTPRCRLGNKQRVIPIITHLRFIKLTTHLHSDGFGIFQSGPRSANGNNYNYQCENSGEAVPALGGSLNTLFRAIKFRRTLNTAIITWEQSREKGENIKSTSANIHVRIHYPSGFHLLESHFLLFLDSPSGQWSSELPNRDSAAP